MCNCEKCMWAIWDYAGMHAVACMDDGEDPCPTEEDVETAERGGYLAYYGCSSNKENDIQPL